MIMGRRIRRFICGSLVHTYKITTNANILFYRLEDRLTMFTIMSVTASKTKMTVGGVCLMFTHIHEILFPKDRAHMISFESECISKFARSYNADTGHTGSVFMSPFGWSCKSSSKDSRSSTIYLFNNPVEKGLCSRALEDRWNFLAYYQNPHPFSKPLVKHNASFHLRRACSQVDMFFNKGNYLNQATVRRLFSKITDLEEREQLTDYIIAKYNFINYDMLIRQFGSYDKLVVACDSTTGSEFDVGEVFDRTSDVPYRKMILLAEFDGLLGAQMRLLRLSPSELDYYKLKYKLTACAKDKHLRVFFDLRSQ